MYAFPRGARVIKFLAAATVVIAGFVGLESTSRAEGTLSQFLAGEIARERMTFGETGITREVIGDWLRVLRASRKPLQRAQAVANLQNCAWVLIDFPETRAPALELLNQWVMPNVPLLRSLPRASGCSWENVVMGVYATYRRAGDPAGEERTLQLILRQSRDPALRDLAALRLAGLKSERGNLPEALAIARQSDPWGSLAPARQQLIEQWERQLKEPAAKR